MDTSPDKAALRALRRHLRFSELVKVGLRVAWGRLRGGPFEKLPPPGDDRERQSRAQIGPAILLYRALLSIGRDDSSALSVTRDVVRAAGAVFLAQTLGPLNRPMLAALDDDGRRAFAEERARRFFNATLRWDAITPDHVAFTVTACHFPRLCEVAGAAALAPFFCEADEAYFGAVEPDVVLERPTTIARGGATCPFSLRFRHRG